MRVFGVIDGLLLVALSLSVTGNPALGQNWRPALHDSDELYDAAEDLHDRAERFQDPRILPVTANLEHLTAQLYQRLRNRACANEIIPLVQATESTLNDAIQLVSLSCQMRSDRKSLSEIENARRHFACMVEQIQCALREVQTLHPTHSPYHTLPFNVPQFGVPQYSRPGHELPPASSFPNRGVAPWNIEPQREYEVRRSSESSPARTLARVLISELLR